MFVCSVGDEVASRAEQEKAKSDRHAIVARYRQLQEDYNKLKAQKNMDVDELTQQLRCLTEDKKREILDLTCMHTMQLTQLQSSLMSDVDMYYSKAKYLEDQTEKQQQVILKLEEEISAMKESKGLAAQCDSGYDYALSTLSSTSSRNSMSTPPHTLVDTPHLKSRCNISEQSTVVQSSSSGQNVCDSLSMSTLQLWNDNLRSELQRLHIEQEDSVTKMESLSSALATSERNRMNAEKQVSVLQDHIQELINSKDIVLEMAQEVQKENEELKNNMRRAKFL